MGKSSTSQPVPDPSIAIREQGRQNRISTRSPFGGQQFVQNEDGSWRQDTTLSEPALAMAQMNSDEALHNRPEYQAPGLDMLTQALMGRVGQQYGIQGLQHAQAAPQTPTPSGPQVQNPQGPPPTLTGPGGNTVPPPPTSGGQTPPVDDQQTKALMRALMGGGG